MTSKGKPDDSERTFLDSLVRTRRGAIQRQESDVVSVASMPKDSLHPRKHNSKLQEAMAEIKSKASLNSVSEDKQPEPIRRLELRRGAKDLQIREFNKEIPKEKKEVEWGNILGDETLSVAERLSLAVNIHSYLCEAPTHVEMQERVDELACPELLVPLLALARVSHPLGYVTLRLLLLFTHTAKSALMIARLGAIPTIMLCLSRPQELECIRYCLEILSKVCTSHSCSNAHTLNDIANIEPRILLHLLTSDIFQRGQIASVRPKLLQTLHAMLVKSRGRQALLKAGAVYTALDLLAQHKKGASFSKTEVSLLTQLKKELLHWDALQQQRAELRKRAEQAEEHKKQLLYKS